MESRGTAALLNVRFIFYQPSVRSCSSRGTLAVACAKIVQEGGAAGALADISDWFCQVTFR